MTTKALHETSLEPSSKEEVNISVRGIVIEKRQSNAKQTRSVYRSPVVHHGRNVVTVDSLSLRNFSDGHHRSSPELLPLLKYD